MKRIVILAAFCASSASAEISVGVLGGVPFTDVVNATSQNSVAYVNSSHYTVGPALQIGLPLGLRVEADALFRPYGFGEFIPNGSVIDVSAKEWRFPLLAQYRFPFPVVRPFIEGGVSFNHLANASATANFGGNFINSTSAGVVLGGGADLKIPLVRLSAELRYTRLGNHYFENISNVNQAEFLFGVHF
jgi:hypothetical protein